MADLALAWDPDQMQGDLILSNGDLLLDDSLYPSVIVSLMTDRLAEIGDAIPDGTANRRGWWGDLKLPNAPDYDTPNLIGSRLWLLSRAKQTTVTLRDIEAYAAEALQWMIEDGVAGSVDCVAQWVSPPLGTGVLNVTINQAGSSATYAIPWSLSGRAPAGAAGNRLGTYLTSDFYSGDVQVSE